MSPSVAQFVVEIIPGARQFVPLFPAFAASSAASRRRIACIAVSPGKISDDGRPAECVAAACGTPVSAEAVATIAAGKGVAVTATGEATGKLGVAARRSNLTRVLRRLIGMCPSSRLSHRRKASSEIATPRPRNAVARTSTESPSRRSRSSSSRCASSCAVFRSRSRRALAANSTSVGGAVGAVSWLDCGDSVVMWERYAERCGSAMGVVLDQSKPRGLDVGVLTYGFLFWICDGFGSLRLLLSLSLLSRRMVGSFFFGFDELVHWLRFYFFIEVNFVGWIEVVIRCFGCSVWSSLSLFGWGENGGWSC